MKKLYSLLLLGAGFLFLGGFLSSANSKLNSSSSSSKPIFHHYDNGYEIDTIEHYRDTIIGNFSGSGVDTLIAEPISNHSERGLIDFIIYSKKGTIAPLYIVQTWRVRMIKEGDLDQNGTEEFGMRLETEISNWHTYEVFTYRKKKWHTIEPIAFLYSDHFYEDLHWGEDAISPAAKKGYIIIANSEHFDDGTDAYFMITRKTEKVKYKTIPHNCIGCGEDPDSFIKRNKL